MALYDKIKIQNALIEQLRIPLEEPLQYQKLTEKIKAMESVIYAVGDYASNHKDDRFGSRRRLLDAYNNYQKTRGNNEIL